VTAARPSRSKLSASCETALLAPGSVNFPPPPALARRGQTIPTLRPLPRASGPPILSGSSLPLRSRTEDSPIATTPQPVKRLPAISLPRARGTEARKGSAPPLGAVWSPRLLRVDIARHWGARTQ
jgi:hypothetical protein